MPQIVWSALIAAVLAGSAVVTGLVFLGNDIIEADALLQAMVGAAIVAAILSLRER